MSARDIDCPHCHATPDTMDIRVIVGTTDGTVTQIRHTKECVDYETWTRSGEEPTT